MQAGTGAIMDMFGSRGMGWRPSSGVFRRAFRVRSVFELASMSDDRTRVVEDGGKIIMPPSALEELASYNIVYPMMFKLENTESGRITHCGVLEFIADEGTIYIPNWMMSNLSISSGMLIHVTSATCPVASFSKFQPQSTAFLDISNPKAVLENTLRRFSCLTKGDMISINYNDTVYELLVLETKPVNAVSIIETDMEVDFAPPVGYVEPDYKAQAAAAAKSKEPDFEGPRLGGEDADKANAPKNHFDSFTGSAARIDGKIKSKKREAQAKASPEIKKEEPKRAGLTLERKKGKPRGRLYFAKGEDEPTKEEAAASDVPKNSHWDTMGKGNSLR